MTWGHLMTQSTLKLRKIKNNLQSQRTRSVYDLQLGRIWFRHIRNRLAREEEACENRQKISEQRTFQWR